MKRVLGVILLSLVSTGVSAAFITASPQVSDFLGVNSLEPGVGGLIAFGIAGLVVARRRMKN